MEGIRANTTPNMYEDEGYIPMEQPRIEPYESSRAYYPKFNPGRLTYYNVDTNPPWLEILYKNFLYIYMFSFYKL